MRLGKGLEIIDIERAICCTQFEIGGIAMGGEAGERDCHDGAAWDR